MARYQYQTFATTDLPRWLAIYGLQWQVIYCQRLDPPCDLSGAMAGIVERLAAEGWQAEGEPRFGFVFICRGGERQLLMLTPKDPHNTRSQSFNPQREI